MVDMTAIQSAVVDPAQALREAGIAVRPIPEVRVGADGRLLDLVPDVTQPVLARGAANAWPQLATWTPEQLAQRYGDTEVTPLLNLPTDGVLYDRDQSGYERRMSFHRFVDLIRQPAPAAPCYLAYARASDLLGAEDGIDFPARLGERAGDRPDTRLWIGSAGTRSMLHVDLKDNVFCQISGRKYVTLLSWAQAKSAYPLPDNLVNSAVDVAAPDPARYPRLAGATFLSAELGPGDIVYIPKGCWHDMRASVASVSVNHWFGPPDTFWRYARLLARMGPRHWAATIRDLLVHGLLRRRESVRFFFSPPSTGKRLWSAMRAKGFSADNDPSA